MLFLSMFDCSSLTWKVASLRTTFNIVTCFVKPRFAFSISQLRSFIYRVRCQKNTSSTTYFIAAAGQIDVVKVVRVEDVMPLLTALLNSGTGAAVQLAEFVPGGANLQGTIPEGVEGVFKAFGGSTSNGAGFFKVAGAQLPFLGPFFPTATTSTLNVVTAEPPPTLAPLEIPEEAARLASMAGAAKTVAKNAAVAVASMPAAALATGAATFGATLDAVSNGVRAKPAEINELLRYKHALWGHFLAGAQAASASLPTEELQNEILGLSKIQPHLVVLLDQFKNPAAFSTLTSLENVFESIKVSGTEDSDTPAISDPTAMKLALANVALSFLESVTSAEPRVESSI